MTEIKKNWPTIKCPHCGAEYLPAEIFLPDDILGRPETIVRDSLGKILYVDFEEDSEPTMTAHYVCDCCDKPFVVEATMSFKVKKEDEEKDFSSEYSSLLDD